MKRATAGWASGGIVLALLASSWLAMPGAWAAAPHRPASPQNLVVNGDFETPNVFGGSIRYVAGQNIDGWGVGGGSVDLVGYWQAATGVQSLDLSGSGPGGVFQDFNTTAGMSYGFGFALSGNPNCGPAVKRVAVTWAGQVIARLRFDTTGHSYSHMGWVPRVYNVTATSSVTEIQFISLTNSSCGAAIDDVLVQGL